MTPTQPHPLMAKIPPEFLWLTARTDPSRKKRAVDLMRWLEHHGHRPTFAEVEDERQRRRDATAPNLHSPTESQPEGTP